MRTTASNSSRASCAYGQARRTSANSASSFHSRQASRRRSAAPARRAAPARSAARRARRAARQSSSAAHSTSSSRDCGNRRAFGTPPTAWPERPTRCRKVAIERGEPSWQTRSTSPMSMPSSSDAVATSTFSSPRFRRCSASSRASLARLPWCAATASLPSRSPRWRAARSAMRRVLTKTSVVRCWQHQLGEAAVDLLPHLVRHHRRERRRRHLEREIALLGVADVDDRAVGAAVGVDRAGADQEARDLVDRLLRRRQADAHERRARPATPAARARARDGCRACSRRPRGSRRRSPCARSPASRGPRPSRAARRATRASSPGCAAASSGICAARAAACRRCARRCGSRRRRGRARASSARMPASGASRLSADVVRQRLQRRDVDDARLVGEAARRQAVAHQRVDRGEERGQRLARAGRRGDQRVPAGADRRPGARPAPRSARERCARTSPRRRDGSRREAGSKTARRSGAGADSASESPAGPIAHGFGASRAPASHARRRPSAARRRRDDRALDAVPLPAHAATKPLALARSTKSASSAARRRRRARRHAHRLLDHHEAAGQQAHAADPRRVGLELLLDAGGDVGALGQELVDDRAARSARAPAWPPSASRVR